MSSIVTAITGGGGKGDAYSPSSTNILNPATTDQANQQYGNVQQGVAQQQNFVNAVNGQNGLGNQTNVYNQLQGIANGTGPNPAQAQLNQATGANVANQAALMAGQRGSGANAGLIARQAAQQGAATQQQAVGQGATMQANQSLNAIGQQGQIATNQVQQQQNALSGYNQAAQGAQQNTLGAIGAQNNANVGIQSNINTVNGQMNAGISGQQGALLGSLAGGAGSALVDAFADGGEVDSDNVYGSTPDSDTDTGATGNYTDSSLGAVTDSRQDQDTIDAQRAAYEPQQTMDQTKAALSAAIPGSTSQFSNIPKVSATPGPASNVGRQFMQQQSASKPVAAAAPTASPSASSGLGSAGSALGSLGGKAIGQGFNWLVNGGLSSALSSAADGATTVAGGAADAVAPEAAAVGTDATIAAPYVGDAALMVAAHGGRVPALVSPGEKYLSPNAVKAVAKGASPMKVGETIPGKAKVKGAKNSYANDTVPKTLQEGGIVLPRSVTQSKNPEWAAHKFVRDVMAKKGLR